MGLIDHAAAQRARFVTGCTGFCSGVCLVNAHPDAHDAIACVRICQEGDGGLSVMEGSRLALATTDEAEALAAFALLCVSSPVLASAHSAWRVQHAVRAAAARDHAVYSFEAYADWATAHPDLHRAFENYYTNQMETTR